MAGFISYTQIQYILELGLSHVHWIVKMVFW